MAAATATAMSGCTTITTHFLFAPSFFLSCRRTISPSGVLINNHRSSVGKFAPRSPPPVANNGTLSSGRRRMQLLCYCTETEAQDNSGDENSIRAAANTLDIRVGKILKAWRHEEADSLYVEEVDVGDPNPRTICSGLVKYIPLNLLQDRDVIVLANLKPRNMRGVKSFGMLMAASDAAHEKVELLLAPEGAVPGQRVWFGSVDDKDNLPDVASPNQVQKKKIWEVVQPYLKTDESCVALLGKHHMRTSAGVVISESLRNATIS